MTMNPLPPQAYTKETLLKAYQWLMVQNSSLKDIATTPDILVSLYLKATRDGDSALDRPSIVNFKNELRSLAGMMGELDRPTGATSAQMQTATEPKPSVPQQMTVQAQVVASHLAAQQQAQTQLQVQAQAPIAVSQQHPTQLKSQATKSPSPTVTTVPMTTQTQVTYTEKSLVATTQALDLMDQLDGTTLAMIQEVKCEFNLSSESEALRMLVKIGFSRSKGMMN